MSAQPERSALQNELALVMRSPEFVRSPVLRRLLEYLVEQTLAGNGERLKAYQIAVDGLGRDDSFDPQSDSYPRVQVGRLRKMLELHYAGLSAQEAAGRHRIVIPVGRYNVELAPMAAPLAGAGAAPPVTPEAGASAPATAADIAASDSAAPHSQAPAGPDRGWMVRAALVLLLLGGLYLIWLFARPETASEEAARRDMRGQIAHVTILTEPAQGNDELNTAAQIAEMHLQRFEMLAVTSATHQDVSETDLARAYLLIVRGSGTGPANTNAPIFLTLRHKASGTTLWSYEVNHDGTQIAAPDVEQAIGAGISEVARSGGVVIQHQRKLLGGDMSPGYPCLIAYDSFRQSRNPAERPAVSKCLEASAKLYPNESLVLQAQSFLELSRPHGKSLVPLTPTPRGRDLAEAALRNNGTSALAQIAVARSAWARGNCPRAIAFSRRAIETNPLEPDTLGLAGSFLMSCGDYAGAEPVLERASAMNEQPGGYQIGSLVITRVINGKRAEALQLALSAERPELEAQPNFLLARALALAANGRVAEGQADWRALEKLVGAPAGAAASDVLARFTISPFFARRMQVEAEATGLVTKAG
ncbi:hypothetical protein [Blastomonas sp. UPD001]|uniref:tetratricopeptide repeat protein n=1 Tax=Blastomonas sp. UPD001 TaxID=2217673 RepID=UPI001300290F|nr:hypothetical protein [Blastomonas sp. UPD001]